MSFMHSIYNFLFLNLWEKSTEICLTLRGEEVSLVSLKTNLSPMSFSSVGNMCKWTLGWVLLLILSGNLLVVEPTGYFASMRMVLC